MANQNDNRGVVERYGIGPDDRTYLVKSLTLAAGALAELAGQFDWCEILSATADTIALSYNQGRAFQSLPRGVAPMFPRTSLLVLKNTGAASSDVVVAYGLGEPPRDSRLVVVGGTQIAVQGIAGGVPVATQDDPLPAAALHSAEVYTNANAASDVFTNAANVNGAWVYFLFGASTGNVMADCGYIDNAITGAKYLRASPNSLLSTNASGSVIRDRPFFVPAGQGLRFVNPAGAFFFFGFANYKLVP